jgi:hypothetical protein
MRREPLLSRARREPEAFAEFYAEQRHHVLGFFARRTLDPETAVDLVAETFAAAFAAFPSFRGESSDPFVGVGYHTASGHLAVSIRNEQTVTCS